MFLLAAIGDISRFPSAKQLVGYTGLGARVHDSGQTHRGGGLTKEGRRDLQCAKDREVARQPPSRAARRRLTLRFKGTDLARKA